MTDQQAMPPPAKLRPQLSPDLVVEAAAKVLERDGFDGLTMRAVAAELKVQAPALYWHFPNKDALQVALFDHLMADLVFDLEGRDWREDVYRIAQQLRDHLLSRRDAAQLLPHGFFVGPNILAQAETLLGVLLGAGLTTRDAAYAMSTGFSYVVSWVIGEADLVARRATGHDERRPGPRPAGHRRLSQLRPGDERLRGRRGHREPVRLRPQLPDRRLRAADPQALISGPACCARRTASA
jgi:TetR/AcrR family tetracycline transcriptional repressor